MGKRIRSSAAAAALRRLTIGACWLALGLMEASGAAIAADKLVLQLHREAQFEFAGYYAALWKGFYREAGLEVEIRLGAPPGAAPVDPVREVIERRAQFGTGSAQLLIRAAQGSPLLLLAPIFQQSGAAIYYRADGSFSSPRALLNAKVGRVPASNILDVELRTALNGQGIDPDKLKSVSIEPGQAITALAERRVDAVVGSAWELPWQAQERSVALKSFALAGVRPEFYGDSLFTLQRFANADPATARRFREASIKGWEYSLRHQDEIAARIVAELPAAMPVSDPAGFARYQSEVAKKLAGFPDVPLGQGDPGRWSAIQQSLLAAGAIPHPVNLETFLYDPTARAWGFSYWLGVLMVIAGVGFALFLTARRFWRRRRSAAVSPEALVSAAPRKGLAAPLAGIRRLTLARAGLARLCATTYTGFDKARKIMRQLAASVSGGRPGARVADLNMTLTALEGSIRRRLPHTVRCRLSLLPEPCLCRANSNAVKAMISKLVGEAAADMPQGGELVVGTRQHTIDHAAAAEFPGSAPGDYVRVTVKDNGSGLSPERLERVFYPGTTARPTVAAAWRLTRRLGGFATVESAEGVGTAVHLYFPRPLGIAKHADDQPVAEYIHAEAAE